MLVCLPVMALRKKNTQGQAAVGHWDKSTCERMHKSFLFLFNAYFTSDGTTNLIPHSYMYMYLYMYTQQFKATTVYVYGLHLYLTYLFGYHLLECVSKEAMIQS